MSHVLLIESKVLGALDIVTRARESRGVRFSFLTSDAETYRKAGREFDRDRHQLERLVELCSSTDPDIVLPAVRELHSLDPIDAVVTLNDPHVGIASLVAKDLGLNYSSPESVSLARDKALFRARLAEKDVPQPRFVVVTSLREAEVALDRLRFPVVVKPVDGHASILTTLARDVSELRAAASAILTRGGYGRSTIARKAVLIEEYLQGELVSVEGLTTDEGHVALGITDRTLGPEPSFMEIGGAFPVPHKRKDEILAVWRGALDAIEWSFGPSHTELMVTEGDVKVIEVNGRLAGGPVPDLVSLAFGIDVYDVVTRMHLGEAIDLPSAPERACANLAFFSPTAGVIEGIEESPLAQEPFVGRYSLFKGTGDAVNSLSSNFDRIGFVVCVSDSIEDAKHLAAQVHAGTRIEITSGNTR